MRFDMNDYDPWEDDRVQHFELDSHALILRQGDFDRWILPLLQHVEALRATTTASTSNQTGGTQAHDHAAHNLPFRNWDELVELGFQAEEANKRKCARGALHTPTKCQAVVLRKGTVVTIAGEAKRFAQLLEQKQKVVVELFKKGLGLPGPVGGTMPPTTSSSLTVSGSESTTTPAGGAATKEEDHSSPGTCCAQDNHVQLLQDRIIRKIFAENPRVVTRAFAALQKSPGAGSLLHLPTSNYFPTHTDPNGAAPSEEYVVVALQRAEDVRVYSRRMIQYKQICEGLVWARKDALKELQCFVEDQEEETEKCLKMVEDYNTQSHVQSWIADFLPSLHLDFEIKNAGFNTILKHKVECLPGELVNLIKLECVGWGYEFSAFHQVKTTVHSALGRDVLLRLLQFQNATGKALLDEVHRSLEKDGLLQPLDGGAPQLDGRAHPFVQQKSGFTMDCVSRILEGASYNMHHDEAVSEQILQHASPDEEHDFVESGRPYPIQNAALLSDLRWNRDTVRREEAWRTNFLDSSTWTTEQRLKSSSGKTAQLLYPFRKVHRILGTHTRNPSTYDKDAAEKNQSQREPQFCSFALAAGFHTRVDDETPDLNRYLQRAGIVNMGLFERENECEGSAFKIKDLPIGDARREVTRRGNPDGPSYLYCFVGEYLRRWTVLMPEFTKFAFALTSTVRGPKGPERKRVPVTRRRKVAVPVKGWKCDHSALDVNMGYRFRGDYWDPFDTFTYYSLAAWTPYEALSFEESAALYYYRKEFSQQRGVQTSRGNEIATENEGLTAGSSIFSQQEQRTADNPTFLPTSDENNIEADMKVALEIMWRGDPPSKKENSAGSGGSTGQQQVEEQQGEQLVGITSAAENATSSEPRWTVTAQLEHLVAPVESLPSYDFCFATEAEANAFANDLQAFCRIGMDCTSVRNTQAQQLFSVFDSQLGKELCSPMMEHVFPFGRYTSAVTGKNYAYKPFDRIIRMWLTDDDFCPDEATDLKKRKLENGGSEFPETNIGNTTWFDVARTVLSRRLEIENNADLLAPIEIQCFFGNKTIEELRREKKKEQEEDEKEVEIQKI
ncbi:unnamed protein product [Amoebophrya sp. A120]|nr:unnamed protein product [Amoebophrya sp. A120]|eukprot:GSA120T00024875001.1